MRLLLLLTILLFVSSGCKKEQAVQPEDKGEKSLAYSFAIWNSYEYHNYTIDQIRQCYCPNGGEKMRVTVRDDTVMSVIRQSDNKELSYSEARWYLTVGSLFRKLQNPGQDSVTFSFNAVFGYPETVDINPQLHPQDGGAAYYTSNLRVP
ncbi:MAG TPA: DUF6174 domain-containing protein [Ignavibacteriales bacterium]|nr:DUF6174 domain-containing protein [Ignavibacteriales bacterium]